MLFAITLSKGIINVHQELEQIVVEVNKVVKGKDGVIRKALAAILAGGHVLLEDIPGVGKTTLAMALGKAMELSCKRMQFTPDVLPSDIVGFTMYNSATGEFAYKKGAVFCNLFLADELNRTSSKTQAALLEVMEEAKVTVDGVSYPLSPPFTVIATENPFGSSGTQLLPESQLDRFLICLSMGYPSHDAALDILKGSVGQGLDRVESVITVNRLMELRAQTENLYTDDRIHEYIVNLAEETRKEPRIALGVSPRGSIALLKMARAMAMMRGGDYVVPEDVLSVIDDVWKHRIRLNAHARAEGLDVSDMIMRITERIHAV
jgi:MoxR-like ATPase